MSLKFENGIFSSDTILTCMARFFFLALEMAKWCTKPQNFKDVRSADRGDRAMFNY